MLQMETTYYPTHVRMSPWLIGVLFGYIMINLKDKPITISKVSA